MDIIKGILITALLAAAGIFTSCEKCFFDRTEDLDAESIFSDTSTSPANPFDQWLDRYYVGPYNINVKYRLEDKESDMSYNLIPADYEKSIALAKLTKFLWLESYEELLGDAFIRTYCPKVIHLVGSPAYNPSSGSVVLGTAEGGMKITLYNVNQIDMDKIDIEFLNYWFFKTMHHEFAHILHQTKNYSTDFNLISLDYQSSSWVNVSETEALNMGYISPYASSEPQEDFVEIISIYVTHDADYWKNRVARASKQGQDKINAKLGIIRDYLKGTWSIDLDSLRDIIQRRSGMIEGLDLTI